MGVGLRQVKGGSLHSTVREDGASCCLHRQPERGWVVGTGEVLF